MNLPKISVLFKTTFNPNGATYYGVHDTTDLAFGSGEFKDPFLGNGTKLIALIKQAGPNPRRLFNVQAIRVSTRKECEDQLKKVLEQLDYTNPLNLNSKEGWPKGRIPTPTHLENKAMALSEALKGNTNAVGRRDGNIDIDTPAGTKLKWFHAPDNSQEMMIVVDLEDNPIKPQYKDWKIGKMHKNKYVQKRLEAAKEEATDDTDDEESDS